MRRDLQARKLVPEMRSPSHLANPGSSARGCYAAMLELFRAEKSQDGTRVRFDRK